MTIIPSAHVPRGTVTERELLNTEPSDSLASLHSLPFAPLLPSLQLRLGTSRDLRHDLHVGRVWLHPKHKGRSTWRATPGKKGKGIETHKPPSPTRDGNHSCLSTVASKIGLVYRRHSVWGGWEVMEYLHPPWMRCRQGE